MEIGEFAVKAGISIDTLRYYDKLGLLSPSRENNRRCYDEEDIEKAAAITKLKNFNFSLDEIRMLFDLEKDIEGDGALKDEERVKVKSCLEIIKEKYNDILNREREIIQVKHGLERMIDKTTKLLGARRFF